MALFLAVSLGAGCGDAGVESRRAVLPLEVDASVMRELHAVESVPVVGLDQGDGEPLRVAVRTPEIDHYPCTSCHDHPIGDRPSSLEALHESTARHGDLYGARCQACHTGQDPRAIPIRCERCHSREGQEGWAPSGRSHLTVEFTHPNASPDVCFTCHSRENPGLLVLQDGGRATMDQAYRLCAGCHYMQAEDWMGGAHGKRLAGWRGERVVLSCTGCHNPHAPRFPIREPVAFPKIPRREGAR